MNTLQFRYAERSDIKLILHYIRELADYEKLLHEVVATEELLEAAGHVHVLSDLVYSETAERNLDFDTEISHDYYTATRILAEGSSVTEIPYTLRVLAGIDSTEARGLLAQDYEYYLVFVNGDQSEGTPLNPWQAIYGYNDGEIVSTAGDRGFALEVEELGGVRETLQELNLP